VQCVVTKVPTPNETDDVTSVNDVSAQNRWLDWFQRDVAILKCPQHNDATTSDRTNKGHACRDGRSNLGAGSRLDVYSAMTGRPRIGRSGKATNHLADHRPRPARTRIGFTRGHDRQQDDQ
jgi:hypothetical protein